MPFLPETGFNTTTCLSLPLASRGSARADCQSEDHMTLVAVCDPEGAGESMV